MLLTEVGDEFFDDKSTTNIYKTVTNMKICSVTSRDVTHITESTCQPYGKSKRVTIERNVNGEVLN